MTEGAIPPVATVVTFIDRINKGDAAGLARMMTDDHRLFVEGAEPVVGREANEAAWRGYAEAFPRYAIDAQGFARDGDRVVVWGTTTGSHLELSDEEEGRLGVLWVAELDGGLVRSWSVLDDTPEHRTALAVPAADHGVQ